MKQSQTNPDLGALMAQNATVFVRAPWASGWRLHAHGGKPHGEDISLCPVSADHVQMLRSCAHGDEKGACAWMCVLLRSEEPYALVSPNA